MNALYFVGTTHVDLKGPERLRKFYDFVRPGLVFLEASAEVVAEHMAVRNRVQEILKKQQEFEEYVKQLQAKVGAKFDVKIPEIPALNFDEELKMKICGVMGYETWVAYEDKANGNPDLSIVPVHNYEVLIKYRTFIGTMYGAMFGVDFQNPEKLGDNGFFSEERFKTFEDFQTWVDNRDLGEILTGYHQSEELRNILKDCDDAMEANIRRAIDANPRATTVFTCGANHFFLDYENNLFDRLSDLKPNRLRLSEIDNF